MRFHIKKKPYGKINQLFFHIKENMQTKRLSKRTQPGLIIDGYITGLRYQGAYPIAKTATIAYNLETVKLAHKLKKEGLKLEQIAEQTGIIKQRLIDTVFHIEIPALSEFEEKLKSNKRGVNLIKKIKFLSHINAKKASDSKKATISTATQT